MKKLLFGSLFAVVIVAPTFASAPQSCPSTSSKKEPSRPLSNLHDRLKELEEFRLQIRIEAEQKRKCNQQTLADALLAKQIAQDAIHDAVIAKQIEQQIAQDAIHREERLSISEHAMLSNNPTIRFEQILRIKEAAQRARERNL